MKNNFKGKNDDEIYENRLYFLQKKSLDKKASFNRETRKKSNQK